MPSPIAPIAFAALPSGGVHRLPQRLANRAKQGRDFVVDGPRLRNHEQPRRQRPNLRLAAARFGPRFRRDAAKRITSVKGS